MIYHSPEFVDADLTLRRGGHVNRTNFALHGWVRDNYTELKHFYLNYGCALQQHPDGCFFLVNTGTMMKTRVLSKACVHLGTFLALKARDPEITKTSGWIPIEQLLQDIVTTVSKETLSQVYAPRTKESVVSRRVSDELQNSIKTLSELKFIEIRESALRPLEAIGRFADLARYDNEPDEIAKSRLIDAFGVTWQLGDPEELEEADEGAVDDES